jgi:hypothetical protein
MPAATFLVTFSFNKLARYKQERHVRLRRVGSDLVGSCPVCGDGGEGARSDRFTVHLRELASAPLGLASTAACRGRPNAG